MDDKFDGIVLTLFGHNIEFQQSVINWLILCVLFSIFFIWAGKKFEKADVRKAPSGILLVVEMITGLCTSIIGDNLKHETKHYLPFLGTLTMMMAVSNLLGLLGLQPPTSNLSFNVTLALMISLSMRLFGNILAGSIIMLLVYTMMRGFLPFGVLGYIATPFLHAYFDVFSGLIQTYIFFTLASFFLSEQVAPEE